MSLSLAFRENHLFSLLRKFDEKNALESIPLDFFVHEYFKKNRSLGSKDRGFIAEKAYHLIRWKKFYQALSKDSSWEKLYLLSEKISPFSLDQDFSLSKDERCSFPLFLYEKMKNEYGEEKAFKLCLILNEEAPITIRVNTLKISADALFDKWKNLYPIERCKTAKDGITFQKRIALFSLPEFKLGFFEMQDEGSQLLASLVDPLPGEKILDYCAGSGGKTLAFAPQMKGKGQIFLHDVRPSILISAKKRLKRAGVQNAQTIQTENLHQKKNRKKMTRVFVDVPCSGTGTLRRNPDRKWKITEEEISYFVGLQRQIFEKALSFVRPNGKIIYGTCSLLKEENEDQITHFLATYPELQLKKIWKSLPESGQMDGFFGAIFEKKEKNSIS